MILSLESVFWDNTFLFKDALLQKSNPSDNIISDIKEKETEKSEIFINKKD